MMLMVQTNVDAFSSKCITLDCHSAINMYL